MWLHGAGSPDQEGPPPCFRADSAPQGHPATDHDSMACSGGAACTTGSYGDAASKVMRGVADLTSRQSGPVEPADSESTFRGPSRSRSDRLAFHKHFASG